MANRYVWSGASGAGTGADWTNAHTTLSAAITAGAAGDVYYVAHDHAETTASALTITFKGTSGTPDRCLCVNRAGSVPPVAADLTTGASVTTTGNSNLFVLGGVRVRGLTFNCGTGANSTSLRFGDSAVRMIFENCTFNIVATGASAAIQPNGTTAAGRDVEWRNCNVSFAATGQSINCFGNRFIWNGGALQAGTAIPTTLFSTASSTGGEIYVEGLDLSQAGSGKNLISGGVTGRTIFRNCKLGASVTLSTSPIQNSLGKAMLIGCNSGSNVQRNETIQYEGVLTTETTIVRTGGATDGTTPYSWKIVSNSNNKEDWNFETFEGSFWNDAVGSAKTLTVHVVTDNVTLTDAEIFLEVDYLGDGSFPISGRAADCNATPLTAAANQASDSGTAWTTTGLTTPVKQKLEVTFTPQNKGPIRWRVRYAKASSTVYICPKPDFT